MKELVENLISEAVASLVTDTELSAESLQADVERTRDIQHGHYASNIAMRLAKPLHKAPRDIAADIVAKLPASDLVARTEIAGPGFINFHLSDQALHDEIRTIMNRGTEYGCSELGAGKKVILEYVSANPTGPLHVGHGRHAAYGATVANLLVATGHTVHQEYYVNDAGRQMDILALSVWLRMLELQGTTIEFPSLAYQGQYVSDIAAQARAELGDTGAPAELFASLPDDTDETGDKRLDALIERGRLHLGAEVFQSVLDIALADILGDIRDDLAEFGVHPDEWFSEKSLADGGAIQHALDLLAENNVTYEQEGAIWFRATDYGDDKDRVVVRDNGRTTYFASDIAYHLHKRERGHEELVDVLGSDHHGYVARVRAGLEAMGQPADCLEVQLVQFVVLFENGEKLKMSTRAADFVSLRKLRAEVGNDAARLFFVLRSNEQHLDFDLDLAKSRSNENPVYYLQYAHARSCSVMRELAKRELSLDIEQGKQSLRRLTEEHEQALMLTLTHYPEIVSAAALQRAPQHIVHYLRDLAQDFHAYYNAHRFIEDDTELRNARLLLVLATQQVLRNGLELLGVSAPESM
ncbi:MAG: arginine--tRNA ligase [Gammaproteobacteria bacterium]